MLSVTASPMELFKLKFSQLVTFQGLRSQTWLVPTVLDSVDKEHFIILECSVGECGFTEISTSGSENETSSHQVSSPWKRCLSSSPGGCQQLAGQGCGICSSLVPTWCSAKDLIHAQSLWDGNPSDRRLRLRLLSVPRVIISLGGTVIVQTPQ